MFKYGAPSGGSSVQSTYSSTVRTAGLLNTFGTSPRATWASVSKRFEIHASGGGLSNQFFATRVKAKIAGGKWAALAPVFVCASLTTLQSPFGVSNTPKVTLAFNLELANGTQTASYDSPNTGGTILQGKFNGVTDGIMQGGGVLVGDFIYASDASLPYFQWTDRTFLPWIRTAWSKTGAGDALFQTQATEYNYPCNSHTAVCTSYANAKTLINTTGVNNYNGGNNFWGADAAALPTCIGFIGIPLDGQKSLVWIGTSIVDGDGGEVDAVGHVFRHWPDWLAWLWR